MSTFTDKNKEPLNSDPPYSRFGDGGGGRILLISDVYGHRQLLHTYMSSAGYEVVFQDSAGISEDIPLSPKADVVIIDIPLDKRNGFQICSALKSSPSTILIPVIILMESFYENEAVRAYAAGADDFMNQPVNRLELLARIRSMIRIKNLNVALNKKNEELKITQNQLKELAIRDELSGAYNHRFFYQQLYNEVSRSIRLNYSLSLIIFDIDNFKKLNDTFGHPAGDKIISRFSLLIMENIRKVDTLARYGGDEFALILPGTNQQSAESVVEKLRSIMDDAYFTGITKSIQKITFSAGIAGFPSDAKDAEELVQLADIALYIAKEKGKNQTIIIHSDHDSI